MNPTWLTLQRAYLRLRKQWIDWTGRSGQIYFHHRVAEYREMWRAVAGAAGGTFTELGRDVWQIDAGGASTRLQNHQMEFDNPVVLALAARKSIVHRLLRATGLEVPEHEVFTLADLEPALRFLRRHPRGCVVKPASGYGGQGVTTHVQQRSEVRRAALLASLYDDELLIEAQIPGESYRLLVLEGTVAHAVCRRGPRLRGDGTSTVRQLIALENAARAAAGRPPLDLDRDCTFTLQFQGLSLDSVPCRQRQFLAKSVNDSSRKYVEVRTVYTETVTDGICPSIRRDAEAAARAVNSEFLGVDIITTDPSVPLRRSGGVINEVNTTPALHHHYDAAREAYPKVALQALEAVARRKAASMAVHR